MEAPGNSPLAGEPIVVFAEKWARLVLQGTKRIEVRHQPLGRGHYWIGVKQKQKQNKKHLVVGRFEVVGQQLVRTNDQWNQLRDLHCCEQEKKPYANTWCMDIGGVSMCQPVAFKWKPGAINRLNFQPLEDIAPSQPVARKRVRAATRRPKKSSLTPWPQKKQQAKEAQESRALNPAQVVLCPISRRRSMKKKRQRPHLWGDDRPAKSPALASEPSLLGHRRDVDTVRRISAGRTHTQLANLMAFRLFQQVTPPAPSLQPKPGVFGMFNSQPVLILDHFTFRGRERCDVVPLEDKGSGLFLACLEKIATVWALDVSNLHTSFAAVPRQRRPSGVRF